jgi:hypothetical protein
MTKNPFGPAMDPSAHMPGQKRAKKQSVATQVIDFDALSVEDDVPMIDRAPVGGKWEPLLAKLKKVGQSIAFPVEHKGAVNGYCLNKKRKTGSDQFRVRVVSNTEARIWRVA